MKDKQINIRVDQQILNLLEFKAKAANLNKTDYIIRAIVDSEVKADNKKDINRIIAALNRIGNNINQIAYNLNVARKNQKIDEIKYDSLLDELTIIRHQFKEIVKNI